MAEATYLRDVLILLVALLVFVPLFQRFRAGSVLGYLAAGVVIGPSALGLIDNVEGTQALAEFGVVFLLFSVGLELKVERLRLFGARAFGLAIAQVLVTGTVLTLAARGVGLSTTAALVVGAGLALSSTAVVLQILGERAQMTGPLGRAAIATLLVQDLAVGPLLVFISVAAEGDTGLATALGMAFLKSVVALVVIIVIERTLLRPMLRMAAATNMPEVFAAATLLVVLGAGWATHEAGLSMALGAFFAGLMVADTEFRHQVAADIQPFRGLLLGLFFITVGMTVDLGLAVERWQEVVLVLLGVVAIKGLIMAGLARAFGLSMGRAWAVGGLLAQGSEFGFVLFAFAAAEGVMQAQDAQVLAVVIALSVALTPGGAVAVRRWAARRSAGARSPLGNLAREGGDLRGHVVVAGFGQVGMAVARHVAGQHLPVVVLDLSPRRVSASRARGLRVFYGNAARLDVLREAHLDRAQALVVAVPDTDSAEQITAVARQAFPGLRIFARVLDEEAVRRLRRAGADAVAPEGLTTALELAERTMLVCGEAND